MKEAKVVLLPVVRDDETIANVGIPIDSISMVMPWLDPEKKIISTKQSFVTFLPETVVAPRIEGEESGKFIQQMVVNMPVSDTVARINGVSE